MQTARQLPTEELPPLVNHQGPPPARTWERRNPEAAARLTAINQTLGSADDQLHTLIDGLGSYGTVSL